MRDNHPASFHPAPGRPGLRLLALSPLSLLCAAMLCVAGGFAGPTGAHATDPTDPTDPPDRPIGARGAESGGITTRTLPPLYFGLQMHTLGGSDEHDRASLEAQRLGARMVRDEAHWHKIEREKGILDIPGKIRDNFRLNHQRGLETLLILNYANMHYDNGDAPTSGEALAAFARYCEFMARELKGECRYFEIWNEPNTDGFWRPRRDAAAYARMLEAAVRAVKRGNPDAVVFGGSLSQIDGEFMHAVCAHTDCAVMDVFSIHPYCTPASPAEANIFERMDALRREVLDGPGRLRPLWVTEIGYPTNQPGGVTERRQAEVIAQTYLLGATRPELQGIIWYWMGPDGPDGEWAEDRFGLLRPRFSGRKPSAYPFDVLAHTLPGSVVEARVEPIAGLANSRILRARDTQGRDLTALYVEAGECVVSVHGVREAEVIPLTGAPPRLLVAREGALWLTVSPMPVLLRSAGRPRISLGTDDAGAPRLYRADAATTHAVRGTNCVIHVRKGPAPALSASAPAAATGRLVMEDDPAGLPWTCENEAAPAPGGLQLHVSADAAPQIAPLAVYWIPPGAEVPAARLTLNLAVVNPVEMDIRSRPRPDGSHSVEVTVHNRTAEARDADMVARIEGNPEKCWEKQTLPPNGSVTRRMPLAPLDAPDAVLDAEVEVRCSGGIRTVANTMLSFLYSKRFEKAPVIDGNLSDWPAGLAPIRLGDPRQITGQHGPPYAGPADASARVWTGWDERFFYLAAEIHDDLFVEEASGHGIYNNDGLEVYVDTDREVGRSQNTYGARQFQFGLFPSLGRDVLYEWQHRNGEVPGGRIRVNRAPRAADRLDAPPDDPLPRYIIEAAIPMTELKLQPAAGLELGFSVALNDDDSPGATHPFGQDLQLQWARRRNLWQRPSGFASLWLGE